MHDVIVVGAGISGLALTKILRERGLDVRLLEARTRVGGRVLGLHTDAGVYDMGPAWVWPGVQPRVDALLRQHGLQVYPQSHAGGYVYQHANGRTQQLAYGFQQSPPSMRVRGGIDAMVHAQAAHLDPACMQLGHAVRRLQLSGQGVAVTPQAPGGDITLHSRHVVLAMPPRLIAGIDLQPALPASLKARLAAVPGWMAGQAKALAIYDRPFWRDTNLSGGASSQCGPLVEIHDASLPDAMEFALFGFIGWPAARRAEAGPGLPGLISAQLATLFGHAAAAPRRLVIQDWSHEPFTATEADRNNPTAHPDYGPIALPAPWADFLTLTGAELAPEFGGYIEGALAAAEAAAQCC